MQSYLLVVITCSLLLSWAVASPVPGSSEVDSNLYAGDGYSISTESKSIPPVTAALGEDERSTEEQHTAATTSEELTTMTSNKPASTTEQPTTTEEPVTIASTEPTVICRDLEMRDPDSYDCMLGDLPLVPSNNTRVHPINGIMVPRKSCNDLYEDGYRKSGLYVIKPKKREFTVFCDMSIIGEGGWTVIQRRLNKSTIFNNKKFIDYQNGFGDFSSSFWLGLDAIHDLTASCNTELYIGLEWKRGTRSYVYVARYPTFCVGDEASQYELKISEIVSRSNFDVTGARCVDGNTAIGRRYYLNEGLYQHNERKFYTSDSDNANNCASQNGGGWWYRPNDCIRAALNSNNAMWTTLTSSPIHNSVMAIR